MIIIHFLSTALYIVLLKNKQITKKIKFCLETKVFMHKNLTVEIVKASSSSQPLSLRNAGREGD